MKKWLFLTITVLFVLGMSGTGFATIWCPGGGDDCLPVCGVPEQFEGSQANIPVCIVVDEFVQFSLIDAEAGLLVTVDNDAFELFLDPTETLFASSNIVGWTVDANTNNFKVTFRSTGEGIADDCNPLEVIGEYVKYGVGLDEDIIWAATGSYTAYYPWFWWWIPYQVHYSNPAEGGTFGIAPGSLEYDMNQMMGVQNGTLQVFLEKELGATPTVASLPAGAYQDIVEVTIGPKI